jgi:hypothetical protein
MHWKSFRTAGGVLLLVVAFALASVSRASAQGIDIEPNSACQTPQGLGLITLPFTLNGNLESAPGRPDVDFFGFRANPGARLIVDLEGRATNRGTLSDPFLGAFDSTCTRIEVDDDGGEGLNSRLAFQVPDDGIVILGVTVCCDDQFVGRESGGTYVLTISPAGRIRGTIVDGLGNPLSPDFIGSFTPSGLFSGGRVSIEEVDGTLTYTLEVAAGAHRVVAQSGVSRVWHSGKPSFLQADPIVVAPDQTVTGVDFVLSPVVRVTPKINRTSFVTGDTLVLDLAVSNLGVAAASVSMVVSVQLTSEAGLDPTFCCLTSYGSLFETTNVRIPATTETTLPGVVTYTFRANDAPGRWSICTLVVQQGRNASQCTSFSLNVPTTPVGDAGSTKGMTKGLPVGAPTPGH